MAKTPLPRPLILGLPGAEIDPKTRMLIQKLRPAGFILFDRNIQHAAQLKALICQLKTLSGLKTPIIAIDQEGGRIQRLKWAYPCTVTAQDFGKLYDKDPAAATYGANLQAFLLAAELAELGFSLNFSPVADIAFGETHQVIGNRAYHHQPHIVAALCAASLLGTLAGGCWPCIKHAPGHGRAVSDSHKNLPVVNATKKELQQDFEPFQQNNKVPFVMTAHVKYTALDGKHCATNSSEIIQNIMRKQLGLHGLIISDDLGMEALEGTLLNRANSALKAGCDLLIVSASNMQTAQGEVDNQVWDSLNTLENLRNIAPEVLDKLQALPLLKTPQQAARQDAEEELTALLQMLV